MSHIILLYSGGLDSTVLLYSLKAEGHQVRALGIDYGQRHSKELDAAHGIARRLGVEYRVANLRTLNFFLAGSSQTSLELAVPEGHYADESMKLTVVPNRNMLLLSIAGAWAISTHADAIAYAAHAGDHPIYPDCRPEFVDAFAKTLALADWRTIQMQAPFTGLSKADIVRRGSALGVPFIETWSCYQGRALHCGKCGTCVERQESFTLAEVSDPTSYEVMG